MAFLAGWSKRQKLTIDHTQVDDELTDFPVKVIVSSDNPLFDTAKSDGSDVRFTAADGETLLKFEREVHDTTEKIAVYHVKIPSVSSTSDTDFYLYYGNASASDASSPNDVWDSNYKLVMHMGSSLEDSTSNGNDGTNYGSTLGLASDGYYRSFREGQYITLYNMPAFTDITALVWIYPKEDIQLRPGNWFGNATSYEGWMFYRWGVYIGNGSTWIDAPSLGASSPQNSWTFAAFSYDGSTIKTYQNNMIITKHTGLSGTVSTSSAIGAIGDHPTSSWDTYINANVGEVRISSIARSDAWIKATSASLHDELLTFGSEESAAPPIQGVHQGVQIIFI